MYNWEFMEYHLDKGEYERISEKNYFEIYERAKNKII